MPATADTSLDTSVKQHLAPTSSPPVDNCDIASLREAVLEVCDWEPSSITSSALGSLNKAVSELRFVNADTEDVRIRSHRYSMRFPTAALTPMALAKHWASLGEDSTNGNSSNSDATVLVDTKTARLASARAFGKDRAKCGWDESKLLDYANFQSLPDDEQDEALDGFRDAQSAVVLELVGS
jgi:hypothetical protein